MSKASLDVIVASHQIAAERRARGQAPWSGSFSVADIFHDDDMPMVDKITEVVRRIKAAPFFDTEDDELVEIVEEMEWIAEGANQRSSYDELADEFDCVWDGFYDWCDLNGRVWVETF